MLIGQTAGFAWGGGSAPMAGNNWTARTSAGSRKWWRMAASADGQRLVACTNEQGYYTGYVYTSADSGTTWTEQTAQGDRPWLGVAISADGMRMAACTQQSAPGSGNSDGAGKIITSADGGATWVERTSAGQRTWKSVAMSADGQKLVAANATYSASYLYTSTDGGATWTARTSAGSRYWQGVAISADGQTILANGTDTLYTTTAGGATWTTRSHRWWCHLDNPFGCWQQELGGLPGCERQWANHGGC